MAGAFFGSLGDQFFCQGEAVAGEGVCCAEDALLRCSAGVEGLDYGLGVAAQRGFLFQLEVGSEAAQAVHLVAHLVCGGAGGAAQALVEAVHPVGHFCQLGVEGVAGGGQLTLAFDGHGAGSEELGQRVRRQRSFGGGREDALRGQLVAAEQIGDGLLDERGGEAGLEYGDAAQNLLVENGGLGEVGDFGGPADGKRGSEEEILKDWAEERGGRDAMRLGGEDGDEIGGGIAGTACLPEAVWLGGGGRGALEGLADAGGWIDEEEQAGAEADGNLGVVAGFGQGAIAVEERGVELVGLLDGGEEDGSAEAVNFGRGGIEGEQALGGEGFGIEIGECLGEGASGAVGGLEGFEGVGPAEELAGLVEERGDGVIKDDAADGDCGGWGAAVSEFFELAATGKDYVIDFREIVVFGGQPEDGGVGLS